MEIWKENQVYSERRKAASLLFETMKNFSREDIIFYEVHFPVGFGYVAATRVGRPVAYAEGHYMGDWVITQAPRDTPIIGSNEGVFDGATHITLVPQGALWEVLIDNLARDLLHYIVDGWSAPYIVFTFLVHDVITYDHRIKES